MNFIVPTSSSTLRNRWYQLNNNKIVCVLVGAIILTIYIFNTNVILTTHKAMSQVTLDLFSISNVPIITIGQDTTRIIYQSKIPVCTGMINSVRWLQGPRYGNIHDELQSTDDIVVQRMLLNISSFNFITDITSNEQLSTMLEQTLCYPQSQFRNTNIPLSYDDDNDDDDDFLTDDSPLVRQWAVKLIYLGIHFHQHQYAISEAEQRYSNNNNNNDETTCTSQTALTNNYGVGRFDYECHGAKYIVMALGGNGLGANVRGGMVPSMMLGLMTNRVVIFMNNIPATDNSTSSYIQKEWTLASCPRKDYQCFFWPVSPCVLTEDDILNAYHLNISEARLLLRRYEVPVYADHHKVWVWTTAFQPIPHFHPPSADKLYDYAQQLVSPILNNDNNNNNLKQYQKLIKRSLESIRTDDGFRDLYHFAAASYKVQHTITMYMLRPHQELAHKLNDILLDIIPTNFNPEIAIGLPIRASDKCDSESECLSFDQHMIIASEMWEKHLNRTSNGTWIPYNHNDVYNNKSLNQQQQQPTVVFTTEATSMVDEHKVFVEENHTVSKYPYFQFQFLTNHHDVTPDSGFMRFISNTTGDADTIMISALSSLKAQLLPRVTIGNCCSNFHILLNDFLLEDCGAASTNTFHCIQETDDPVLVVCCGWQHDCHDKKEKILLEMMGKQDNQ